MSITPIAQGNLITVPLPRVLCLNSHVYMGWLRKFWRIKEVMEKSLKDKNVQYKNQLFLNIQMEFI